MQHTLEVSRLVLAMLMTAVVLVFAAKRVLWLTKLISSGQKVGDERGRKNDLVKRFLNQNKEVFAQSKLLKWSIPGIAHFFTMWGFFVLGSVYVEAFGVLFDPEFHIPFVGRWPVLGFLQDFFALMVLLGIVTFAIIRVAREPKKIGRESRFYGSHTGGAWEILFMIFLVIATYVLFRGAAVNVLGEEFPYQSGAFLSDGMAWLLAPLGATANMWIETLALMGHIGVMLVFLLIVLHSKHLHIGLAPINVTFKRLPDGLGPLLPMEHKGEPIDFDDPAEDAVFGRGKIEDFTWKGYLDFTTCTECGRCQSQCPAWNTGKPLSPKLVIMNLRDHMFAKAPYFLDGKESSLENTPEGGLGEEIRGEKHDEKHSHDHVPESGFERIPADSPLQATRPLVGTLEQGGVIDPDVLWSCTNCGACVEQCPVDIEHIDHIVDMRRYQVMVESEFPGELGVLFKNLENKGNPWGQNLGRLRGRLRGPREEDHQGGRRTALHRRREVPGAGHRRDLHRRLRPARRQRVPVPAARGAERRDHQRVVRGCRGCGPQGGRHLPALLQHDQPRVPPAGQQLHRGAPHPAAQPPGPGQAAHPGDLRRPGSHLPRPVLPGPAQQGVRGSA
ncbi:MAG: putative iron-sulfur-binding reductase [Mycobacterium sp.]|nr:putative iron-sulfur-binding reductase [Mycobacterium sp.]